MDFLSALGGNAAGFFGAVLSFLVVLTVVVFVHELGHFLAGRWCGVGVTAFSVGFGPELFGYTDRHGTRWKLSAIPLGGYVKFFGDANGASMPDAETLARMSSAERALSLAGQSVSNRTAIVAAGPIANFILAIGIFAAIFMISGRREVPPAIGSVVPHSAAEAAGFKPDDVVLSINGSHVAQFEDITRAIEPSADEMMRFVVIRDGQPIAIDAVPAVKIEKTVIGSVRIGRLGLGAPRIPAVVGKLISGGAGEAGGLRPGDRVLSVEGAPIDSFQQLQTIVLDKPGVPLVFEVRRGEATERLTLTPEAVPEGTSENGGPKAFGRLGMEPAPDLSWSNIVHYGPANALRLGIAESYFIVARSLGYLGKIVVGRESADQLSGPIGIARVSGQVAKVGGLGSLINLIAWLSISIGLLNLFPIPLLDGGHLMFYAYEAMRGRPLSERAQEIGFRIGLAIVLVLMLFAAWNDLLNLGASFRMGAT